MLLFSSDLRKAVTLARKTLLSLFIAIVLVMIVVFSGYFIFREPGFPAFGKVGGMLVGVYTGGTPNLASLKLMLGIEPGTYIAVHTYDMVISTVYLLLLMTAGQKLFSLILPKINVDNR